MGKREDGGASVLLNFLVAENYIPDDIVVKFGKTKPSIRSNPRWKCKASVYVKEKHLHMTIQ